MSQDNIRFAILAICLTAIILRVIKSIDLENTLRFKKENDQCK